MLKVSIIVPVYNVEQYIEECFMSIVEQDYPSLECVFVNDCTPDNSVGILKNKIEDYLGAIDFKIVNHEKNAGLSAARNTGLSWVTGDYVLFLDSDDKLLKTSVQSLVKCVNSTKKPDIVVGNVFCDNKDIEEYLNIGSKRLPDFSDNSKWLYNNFLLNVPITAWNKLYNRAFLNRDSLRFEEGIFHEDVLWHFQVAKYLKSIAFCFDSTYYYRYNESSITTSASNEKRRIASNFKILDICLESISQNRRNMENLYIVKYYRHVKMLTLQEANQKDFDKIFSAHCRRAIFHRSVSLGVKMMYLYLMMPKFLLSRFDIIWNRSLGVLYRLSKK